MSILIAILVFGTLIFIHELGHFLVARLFGVTILEFSIGMGPKLFSKKSRKSGIVYSLRLFPIGGFVSMLGENGMEAVQGSAEPKIEPVPNPDGEKIDSFFLNSTDSKPVKEESPELSDTTVQKTSDPHAYCNQAVWKRILISLAGPAMNVFLGFLLMFSIVWSGGIDSAATTQVAGFYVQYTGEENYFGLENGDYLYSLNGTDVQNRILSFEELKKCVSESETGKLHLFVLRAGANDLIELPAVSLTNEQVDAFFTSSLSESAGLQRFDVVKKIGKTSVHIYDELAYEVMIQGNQPVSVTVERNGQTVTVPNVIFPSYSNSGAVFGDLDFIVYREPEFDLGTLLRHSWYRSLSTVKMVFDSLIGLSSGRYGVEAVSGPIGITKELSTAAKMGINSLLYFVAVISINLGVVNLLPIPAMDGGHIFLYLIEWIRRKPLKPEVEGLINFIGLILILGLAVLIAIKDIITL